MFFLTCFTRMSQWHCSFEHRKQMFKLIDKEIITILCSKLFHIWTYAFTLREPVVWQSVGSYWYISGTVTSLQLVLPQRRSRSLEVGQSHPLDTCSAAKQENLMIRNPLTFEADTGLWKWTCDWKLILLFLNQNVICCGYSKRTASMRQFFWAQKTNI